MGGHLFAHGGHRQHVQPGVSQTYQMCKLAHPLDHLDMPSSCSIELIESPEEHTLSSFAEVGSQRVLEILDSIGSSQRFSIEKSFVRYCISDQSVLQYWSSFSWFQHCKIQPIINQLLILEPGSWPIRKWWNFISDPTSCCPLICRLCAICSNQSIGKSSRSSS